MERLLRKAGGMERCFCASKKDINKRLRLVDVFYLPELIFQFSLLFHTVSFFQFTFDGATSIIKFLDAFA